MKQQAENVPFWFPFYWSDFEEATVEWTAEEVGIYLKLLIHQWRYESIPP